MGKFFGDIIILFFFKLKLLKWVIFLILGLRKKRLLFLLLIKIGLCVLLLIFNLLFLELFIVFDVGVKVNSFFILIVFFIFSIIGFWEMIKVVDWYLEFIVYFEFAVNNFSCSKL